MTLSLNRKTTLNSLAALSELNVSTAKAPQPQPEPLVFTGPVNTWYKTVRNGRESRLFLIEVRKDVAIYKDDPEVKHSQSMSLAKFMKFYKPATHV